MAAVPRWLKIGCLSAGGCGTLAIAGLVLLAWWSDSRPKKPPVPLDAAERVALDAVLLATGLKETDLRPVGPGARLDIEANHRAIAMEGGQVRLLSLQNVAVKEMPSLSAFTRLEGLSLAGCGLTSAPDLAGCRELRNADLSRNQIPQLDAARLPPRVKTLDLSENPLADLSPLATLKTSEEIHVRKARVNAFDMLVDLPLTLLDLRDNPLTSMPEKLPQSPNFRVDVAGCPVASPPGYLTDWSFGIRQAGVVGQRQTSEGLVNRGRFQASGTWAVVPQLTTVELPTSPTARGGGVGVVDLEVTVEQGRLRVYLGAATDPRGPWFQEGYVTGTDGLFQKAAKIYADATPGQPARLRGHLESIGEQPFYFYIEPQGKDAVSGMAYRVWRE